jgi:integrase
MRLSEKGLATIRTDRQRDFTISGRRGLILRVEPNGDHMRRVLRYRFKRDGKSTIVVLGEHSDRFRVSDIHALHARCVQVVDAGGDPRAIVAQYHHDALPEHARPATGPTVADVITEFLTHHAAKHRKRPEAAQALLERNVLPHLGTRAAADIRKRDIIVMLDRIVDRGSPVMANRVQALLKQAFDVAADRDLIESVPTFPRRPVGGDESARTRVLTDAEIRTLWHGLDKHAKPRRPDGTFPRGKLSRPLALALKLQLVTAQRRGELAAARWSDIRTETVTVGRKRVTRFLWNIPDNKADRPHTVPLSPLACTLLDELRTISGDGEYWLPSGRTGDVMTERARSIGAAARDLRKLLHMADWRGHDLRRTARTNMARLGVPEVVAERVLNHAPESAMAAVYNQHAYRTEMRDALDRWAAHLQRVVK